MIIIVQEPQELEPKFSHICEYQIFIMVWALFEVYAIDAKVSSGKDIISQHM